MFLLCPALLGTPHSSSGNSLGAAAVPELAGDGAKQGTGMNNLICKFKLFIYATFMGKLWFGLVTFSFMKNALNFKLGEKKGVRDEIIKR